MITSIPVFILFASRFMYSVRLQLQLNQKTSGRLDLVSILVGVILDGMDKEAQLVHAMALM